MNTANITSNLGLSPRYNTRKKPKSRTFFGDSPQEPRKKSKVDKNSGKENAQLNTRTAKTVSEANDSPFKILAGSVYGGQGHAAIGIFTPSNLMWSPSGNSDLFSFGSNDLQGLPLSTSSIVRPSVGISFSLNDEFKENTGCLSDSEKSDSSGITDPMSTSASDGDFFQLSDSDYSRDSFSSQGISSEGSSEAGDFDEADIDLNELGFEF